MRSSLVAAALVLATAVYAQPRGPQDTPQPDATPPALRLEGLIPLEVPGSPSMRWGIDPQSLQVTADGVVRYVVVAQSESGAVSAFHESLRCSSAEVKVNARRGRDGDWIAAGATEPWRNLFDTAAARHSLVVARAGACSGPMTNGSAPQIVRELRRSSTGRYTGQSL